MKIFFKNSCCINASGEPYFLVTTVFFFLTIFCACNKPPGNALSSLAYDKVLDTAIKRYDAGQRQKAIAHLDSVTGRYKNITIVQRYHYYYHNYNLYYHTGNDKAKAMLYADSMLHIFKTPAERAKYAYYYGGAYFFKGDIYFDENKYEDAYQSYYLGRIIASKSLDDCTLGDYSYRMGMIMYKQEHYRIAAAYFKMSTTQSGACDWNFSSFYRRQELINNTGLSYSKINEDDSAMLYYHATLKYLDSAGAQFTNGKNLVEVARGVVYGDEANEYIKKHNPERAKALLKKSIEINLTKGNDNHDAELSEIKLAHIYEQQNKPDSLMALLNNVHNQLDSVKNDAAEADWNMMMANYLNKTGAADKAYIYLLRYDFLKDSINNNNRELKQADINQQMDRLKKNYEFERLKKNNHVQHLYLNVAIIFGAMLLIIIFLIWFTWQRSKQNMKTLGRLNDQINDQNYNLENALTELSQSSREKDRILRNVAHDLRNPLGGVASLTGLMVEESEYTDDQKELIQLIKDTSNNSLELINEILEATDEVSTKISRKNELVEINTLLSNSIELMRFKAAEKNQEIKLELLDTPLELLISREKIWRVISNLVSNAIKFSPDGSMIKVMLFDEADHIKIAVADNGIGIPDELKNTVFNMFTDAKRPGTAGEKSFGLGLSICKQIIENHKGKIWFESEAGKGTTFYVKLNKTA